LPSATRAQALLLLSNGRVPHLVLDAAEAVFIHLVVVVREVVVTGQERGQLLHRHPFVAGCFDEGLVLALRDRLPHGAPDRMPDLVDVLLPEGDVDQPGFAEAEHAGLHGEDAGHLAQDDVVLVHALDVVVKGVALLPWHGAAPYRVVRPAVLPRLQDQDGALLGRKG
jgi:hypothetical protein